MRRESPFVRSMVETDSFFFAAALPKDARCRIFPSPKLSRSTGSTPLFLRSTRARNTRLPCAYPLFFSFFPFFARVFARLERQFLFPFLQHGKSRTFFLFSRRGRTKRGTLGFFFICKLPPFYILICGGRFFLFLLFFFWAAAGGCFVSLFFFLALC